MQTFLPYADVKKSFQSLDWRRLGKQRSETKQLLQQILIRTPSQLESLRPGAYDLLEMATCKPNAARLNHPACVQWWDHAGALAIYHDLTILVWKSRGYQNNMPFVSLAGKHAMPKWWGDERFHASHRSNLLRKDPVWYGKHGWTDDPTVDYFWPSRSGEYPYRALDF